jgi:hypothetical protein
MRTFRRSSGAMCHLRAFIIWRHAAPCCATSTCCSMSCRCVVVFGVTPDLRRQILVLVSSALSAAWRSPPEPWWPLLLVAAASLSITYIGLVIAPAIVLGLEADSDSTSLYASFATSSAMAEPEPEGFPLVTPHWRVDLLLGSLIEAKVYCDPYSRRPVAFPVPSGPLWCLPYADRGC